MRNQQNRFALATLLASSLVLYVSGAGGHSVAQVQTAKRIAASTVVLLDPQGNPTPGGTGSDTIAQIDDILTFVIQFTPVPNSATRGGGGYITEYIPVNTEVVGARLIDKNGNTVRPKRGGQYHDGYGPKNRHDNYDTMGLGQGSMSAVYADTGIFYSESALTVRFPADDFITVANGLAVTPVPTGAGKLAELLGFTGPPFYAHNEWDRVQAIAYGASGGSVTPDGRGAAPFLYGSAVAGPDSFYPFEKVLVPACSNGMNDDAMAGTDYPADAECASALDNDETGAEDGPVGPWKRIRFTGSEIGSSPTTGGETDCDNCASDFLRVGVPTDLGWDLSADNPLPAGTNAVRFAVGELIVGQEYFAEISLRVVDLPLDETMMADVNCSEVFGGDAAMPQNGQDNTWRYFLPSPSCVELNLFFELSVDRLIAVTGDTLTYTIKGKNLSVNQQDNVVVTDTFDTGDVTWKQNILGPDPTVGAGLLTWPSMTLAPGQAYTFQWEMTVVGNQLSTLNRARYTSMTLPSPGFSVVALTTIEPIVVMELAAGVMPGSVMAGDDVEYTVTLTNNGTGPATIDKTPFIEITLPAGFSYCAPATCMPPTIDGNAIANPTITGQLLRFTTGIVDIPAGAQSELKFFVTVGGVSPDKYTIDVQSQLNDAGIGKEVENSLFAVAPLLVGIMQSEQPAIDEPVIAGATTVTGVSSEGLGATVTVFVNGNSVAPVLAGAGGVFSAAVPTLYAGQHLNATAQTTGEIESEPSAPDVVVAGAAVTFCNNGDDDDGDGLVDFPDDPGCDDPLDPDETDVPECADGADNDGDGLTDFADDPGCSSDDDPNESDIPACSNGLDDDGDTLIDYPTDLGCDDAYDDDESEATGSGGAGGGAVGSGGAPAGAGGIGSGTPPDPGGIGEFGADLDGGCGCRVAGRRTSAGALAFFAALAAFALRRGRYKPLIS